MRTIKSKEKNEDDGMDRDLASEEASSSASIVSVGDEKPRKKKNYRKPKSKFAESYPSYIQDAFFGRELLDTSKDALNNLPSSDSESNDSFVTRRITSSETIKLSQVFYKLFFFESHSSLL